MFAWLGRARRWKWIDTVLVRIEAYTALMEQYPALKWALRAAGAAVIALWTWISESWIPLAIVAGLGAFVALSFLPQAINPKGMVTPDGPERDQKFTDNPEAEALDKGAYNEIVAFCIDRLIPACEAQVDLQQAIIRHLCSNETVVRWAIEGLRSDYNYKTKQFWENYSNLSSGLTDSPGPSIKFEGMLECIHELEREFYKNFCDQGIELGKSAKIELKHALIREWNRWLDQHQEMVTAYQSIKRDIRFGKLHRLKPSRWGTFDHASGD